MRVHPPAASCSPSSLAFYTSCAVPSFSTIRQALASRRLMACRMLACGRTHSCQSWPRRWGGQPGRAYFVRQERCEQTEREWDAVVAAEEGSSRVAGGAGACSVCARCGRRGMGQQVGSMLIEALLEAKQRPVAWVKWPEASSGCSSAQFTGVAG
jgi:hypothetical protein